jgi:hypothetical protein
VCLAKIDRLAVIGGGGGPSLRRALTPRYIVVLRVKGYAESLFRGSLRPILT